MFAVASVTATSVVAFIESIHLALPP
jgi:hypothetical protein